MAMPFFSKRLRNRKNIGLPSVSVLKPLSAKHLIPYPGVASRPRKLF